MPGVLLVSSRVAAVHAANGAHDAANSATSLSDPRPGRRRPPVHWSVHGPTSGLVVFDTHDNSTGPFSDLAVVPASCAPLAACTAATRLLTSNTPGYPDFGPALTVDGRGIVFLEFRDPQLPDLWVINTDGSHRRCLTNNPEVEISPASGRVAWPR